MTHRKKLIEVALPLEAINRASAREKLVQHGHPSALQVRRASRPFSMERIRLPETRLLVTPAVEAQLNERQRVIVKHVAETGSVTTGWCMETLGVARDTAHRDLIDLVKRKILLSQGAGRGAGYVLRAETPDV